MTLIEQYHYIITVKQNIQLLRAEKAAQSYLEWAFPLVLAEKKKAELIISTIQIN